MTTLPVSSNRYQSEPSSAVDSSLFTFASMQTAQHPDAAKVHRMKSSFPHVEHYSADAAAHPGVLSGYEEFRGRCSGLRMQQSRIEFTPAQGLAVINAMEAHADMARRLSRPLALPCAIQQTGGVLNVHFDDSAHVEYCTSPRRVDESLRVYRTVFFPDDSQGVAVEPSRRPLLVTDAHYDLFTGVQYQGDGVVRLPLLAASALHAGITIRRYCAAKVAMELPSFVDIDAEPLYPAHKSRPAVTATFLAFSDGVVAALNFDDACRNQSSWRLCDSYLYNLRGQPMDAWDHRFARLLNDSKRLAVPVRFLDGSFPEGRL